MTTTITLDNETREKALKKAKTENLSLSAVIRILLSHYANDNIQITTRVISEPNIEEIKVTPKIQSKMEKIIGEFRKNENNNSKNNTKKRKI